MNNILISGANRGIGLAFVTKYLQRGDHVIASCRHIKWSNESFNKIYRLVRK